MKIISRKSRLLISVVVGCVVGACAVTGCTPKSTAESNPSPARTPAVARASAASIPVVTESGGAVCGKSILDSPFSYHGQAGSYASGTPGLPTYGKSGTDFPEATAGMVIPAGTNDYPSYKLNPGTVYYLLPGTHTGSFQADTGDAFVGGRWHGQGSILTGNYTTGSVAIDSNESIGNRPASPSNT